MAGKYDITIYQGARFAFDFIFEQEAPDGSATPVDLSGASVRMQIRLNHRSQDIVLDLGANNYIWVEDATAGKIRIDVPADVTEGIYFRNTAVYDIEVDFGAGNVLRPLEGVVELSPEVTRTVPEVPQ